jgi:hypothetical protein
VIDGRRKISAFILVVMLCAACGKKAPPLPPLVKIPTAPTEFSAERRADTIEFRFVVPATNTDGTRPANVERVDVYALPPPAPVVMTGPPITQAPLTVTEILKTATKVASVAVKAPRDPNATIEPDDPDSDMDAPEGKGLDQGAVARISNALDADASEPVDAPKRAKTPKPTPPERPDEDNPQPLLAPPWVAPSRTYVSVGVTTRGRPGLLSARATVPLLDPPDAPDSVAFTYSESAIAVTWTPVTPHAAIQAPATTADEGVLPSRPIGVELPTIAYNVYDASSDLKLTPAPLRTFRFSDTRVVWNEERCYSVRAVETRNGLSIESEPAFTACETLVDTFPPAAPKGLDTVAGDGAINLIWEPNAEKDLAGYLVLRGVATGGALEQITPAPIQQTFFKDAVPAGAVYVYAVRAVDAAGNVSEMSNRKQESARD